MLKGALAIKHQSEEKTRSLGSAVSRSGMDGQRSRRRTLRACDALLALAQNLPRLSAEMRSRRRKTTCTGLRRAAGERGDSASAFQSHPARNFKEACQAFYLFQLYSRTTAACVVNPEGADKAPLLPWYQRDIANGTLTPQRAYER